MYEIFSFRSSVVFAFLRHVRRDVAHYELLFQSLWYSTFLRAGYFVFHKLCFTSVQSCHNLQRVSPAAGHLSEKPVSEQTHHHASYVLAFPLWRHIAIFYILWLGVMIKAKLRNIIPDS